MRIIFIIGGIFAGAIAFFAVACGWLRSFMDAKDIILTYATFFGPIFSALIAIYYTRYADKNKLKIDRRFEVFRNLMKTRALPLHPDHVMSLNLVQADFFDDTAVMTNLKNYIDHLYRSMPSNPLENQRFSDERGLLFGKLLVSIAQSLNVQLNADELRHFGYMPSGWAATETEQQQLRKLLINMLQGLTPIVVRPAAQQSPEQQTRPPIFPPAPPNT